jgi:nitrite reductase (NO-forming)
MTKAPSSSTVSHAILPAVGSALRVVFGMIWATDAYLAWRPGFAAHYVGYLHNASHGQPSWLAGWFAMWIQLVTPSTGIFVALTRIVETVIAIGLVLGLARKPIYVLGALFSLLVWATAEGLSGPYIVGAANLGPALIYVLMFVALFIVGRATGRTPYSLDYYVGQKVAWWTRIAEPATGEILERTPARLPWGAQGAAIAVILGTFALMIAGMQSALAAQPATPENAAKAVDPLSLATLAPEPAARDATLPPLLADGEDASVTLEVTDNKVRIANGVDYLAWTFNGTVPSPLLHIRQGQKLTVTLVNHGSMPHSIDFHAAQVPPDVYYKSIAAGESFTFSFVATVPGAFIYHCGTPPVLIHMANGMYGALIVEPAKPLPPADKTYVLVQGEWYTHQVEGTLMGGDSEKMMHSFPDEVVFNGLAFQYKDHPLEAHAGKRVRIYFVDAGPNLSSAFHVIGGIFETVYPDGDPSHALTGVSTYEVAPGAGAIFDIVIPNAGKYPIVDHAMRNMETGAMGLLDVKP